MKFQGGNDEPYVVLNIPIIAVCRVVLKKKAAGVIREQALKPN